MSTPERAGLAGSFIPGLVRGGLGPTAGLRAFREAGGSIRTQTWFSLWSETIAAIGRAGGIAKASTGRRPSGDELSRGEWSTRQRYTYMVDVLVREVGTSLVYSTTMSVTSDRLLTYGAALDSVLGYAGAAFEEYEEEVMGGVVSGVYDRELE